MADVNSKYIVRTNVHRKKLMDMCVTGVTTPLQFTHMLFGTGGKTSTGELKVPNGAVPQLFTQVKKLPLTLLEKVNDLEYILKAEIDTSLHPELVGKDINERAIADVAGIVVLIETFPGFGVLQENKTYEYAIRFTVI